MFAPPHGLEAHVFASIPGTGLLEGPAFDRGGYLWVVDLPNGRMFRIAPDGAVATAVECGGHPNGLAIHRDGHIFVADRQRGLVVLDPASLRSEVRLAGHEGKPFKGLNDLVFSRTGDLYFTDQGETGLHDPTGRLFRLRAGGSLEVLLDNVPSPNGLVLTPDESILYLAVTRGNCIWRVPLFPDGGVGRVGVWIQLSGGTGPDGLAMDRDGRIVVAHIGLGTVWVFDRLGEPVYRVRCPGGLRVTNVAFGPPAWSQLYITEGNSGQVFTVALDIPGVAPFSHST